MLDNSTFRKIEGDSTEEKPRNHTVTYSYILYRTCMWNIMVLQRFYGCIFCLSKKSLFEKIGDVGRFIIEEYVTAKAIHVLHLSECARCYGSDKKTKWLVGLVVTSVNIHTSTGRASWFVRVWFHLGGGHTTLHELSVRSVKKAPTPVIHEEEKEIAEGQEIPDAVPIYGRLRVDTIVRAWFSWWDRKSVV